LLRGHEARDRVLSLPGPPPLACVLRNMIAPKDQRDLVCLGPALGSVEAHGHVFGHVLGKIKRGPFRNPLISLVGEGGFEPPTPCL